MIIRNARIENAEQLQDIRYENGVFTEIGTITASEGEEELDVHGKLVLPHQIIYLGDRAVGAVFDRQDAEAAQPPLHRLEHALEGFHEHNVRELEGFIRRQLGVRALDPLARDHRCVGEGLVRLRRDQAFKSEYGTGSTETECRDRS